MRRSPQILTLDDHVLTFLERYREKFEKIQKYFEPRFPEATKLGNEMIRTIEENLNSRKQA